MTNTKRHSIGPRRTSHLSHRVTLTSSHLDTLQPTSHQSPLCLQMRSSHIGDRRPCCKDSMTDFKIPSWNNTLGSLAFIAEGSYIQKRLHGSFTTHLSPTHYNNAFQTLPYHSTQIPIAFLN